MKNKLFNKNGFITLLSVLTCLFALIGFVLIKTNDSHLIAEAAASTYVADADWASSPTSAGVTLKQSSNIGNTMTITSVGDFKKVSGMNAWGDKVYTSAFKLDNATINFYNENCTTSGEVTPFGFSLGSSDSLYPGAYSEFSATVWPGLYSQTRLVIATNHAHADAGNTPIAYTTADGNSKNIGAGGAVTEIVMNTATKIGFSMTFHYLSSYSRWKVTTEVLYGNVGSWVNSWVFYVPDSFINAVSGTGANKTVKLAAFSFANNGSAPANPCYRIDTLKGAGVSKNSSNITTVAGFNAYGQRANYSEMVYLDGLTVEMYGQNFTYANTYIGDLVGFGLSSSANGYAPSEGHFCASIWNSLGSSLSGIFVGATHDYSSGSILYKNNTLKTKATYITYTPAAKIGASFTFAHVGTVGSNDVWSVTIANLYGTRKGGDTFTTFYFNGNILSDVLDDGGNCWVVGYGFTGEKSTALGTEVCYRISSTYNPNFHEYNDKQLVTSSSIVLDGASVTMTVKNFNGTSGGQCLGFGITKTNSQYPPALNTYLNITYWSGIESATTQNRVFFGKNHDYNTTSIAYTDSALLNNSLKFSTKLIFNKTAAMSIKFTFHNLSSQNVWRIDYTVLEGSIWEGQADSIFISNSYISGALSSGKCYIVAYGFANNSSVPNPYGTVTAQAGYTVTETSSSTKTTKVASGEKYFLPAMDNDTANNKVFVGWLCSNDSKLYSGNTEYTVTSNVTFTAKYVTFSQTNGASIFKANTIQGSGIRYQASLDQTSYNSLSSYIKAVGIIIMPSNLIKDKDFTMENYPSTSGGGVAYEQIAKSDFDFVDGAFLFKLSVTNLYAQNYNREFAGRAYLVVTANDKDTYVYVDFDYANNSRAITAVAAAAIKNGETDPEGVMENIIDRSLNLTYSGGISGTFAIADKLDRASSDRITKSVLSGTGITYSTNADGTVSSVTTTLKIKVDSTRFVNELGGKFSNVTINGKNISGGSQSRSGSTVTITFSTDCTPLYERDGDAYSAPYFAVKGFDYLDNYNRNGSGALTERPKADNELLYDLNFSTGFITTVFNLDTGDGVTDVDGVEYGGANVLDINSYWDQIGIPYGHQWLIGQWGCRHQFGINVGSDATFTRNGSIMRQDDGGKYIELDTSKIGCITLGIKGSAEYSSSTYARKSGESWPHMLVQSAIERNVDTSYDHLYMEMDYEVTKCDLNQTKASYDPTLHTAQFQWYIALFAPESAGSSTYAQMAWVGIQFFDANYQGANIPEYRGWDGGKSDHTDMYIYKPSLKDCAKDSDNTVQHVNSSIVGLRNYVKVDVIPYIQEALNILHSQGNFTWVTNLSQILIPNHNFGWEIQGNYDVETQINYLNLYYE